jgi:hypothetical protein
MFALIFLILFTILRAFLIIFTQSHTACTATEVKSLLAELKLLLELAEILERFSLGEL